MQQRHISVDIIGGVSGFKTSTEHYPHHTKIVRRICEIRLLLFIQKEKGEEQKKNWKELEQKKRV